MGTKSFGVTGTHGKNFSIQVLGVGEVMRNLRLWNIKINDGADSGVVKAGAFIRDEVIESIGGQRAEHQSVDTGVLINDIKFVKTGNASGIVKPGGKSYPGGQNTKDVATILEYSKNVVGGPRRHFGNTEKRTKSDVKAIIKKAIKVV